MIRLSASKAPLLLKCKYPFRSDLPANTTIKLPLATPGEDARIGRALHRCAELYINPGEVSLTAAAMEFGVEAHHAKIARYWARMAAWIDERLNDANVIAEKKFALDLEQHTGRMLTATGERDYSEAQAGEIPMTLDVVEFARDARPRFFDWKTGHTAEGYSGQIAMNALAVAYYTQENLPLIWAEHQSVEGGVLHVTGEGIDDSRVRVFDKYDLVAIADDFRRDVAAIPGAAPTEGAHCIDLHCHAFGTCPKTLQAVDRVGSLVPAESLLQRGESGFSLALTMQSADHAAWCKQQLRTFDHYKEAVNDAVKAFVGSEAHPLVDGVHCIKETFREVSRTSTAELIALALAKGATDDEIAACSHTSRESAGIRVVKMKRERAA